MKTLDIVIVIGALALVAGIWWFTRSRASAAEPELDAPETNEEETTMTVPGPAHRVEIQPRTGPERVEVRL